MEKELGLSCFPAKSDTPMYLAIGIVGSVSKCQTTTTAASITVENTWQYRGIVSRSGPY